MGQRKFFGRGVGFGIGAGCGFGIGWGFGGSPIGPFGISAGAGCGLGAGLGWGFGLAYGAQYIDLSPEFTEGKAHRPGVIRQVQHAIKRLATIANKASPSPPQPSSS